MPSLQINVQPPVIGAAQSDRFEREYPARR